ncbi:hypothetical protein GHT06_019478 [Daphnia sinensis]|uniref:Uncharacterized protein n=1 Tax=Daphnia sinensis TaxID=1820382 RepID=A0AAD5PNN5_9CRUS|nr:hypothetical protein GHT06_019478 [Daphnia sinensis]
MKKSHLWLVSVWVTNRKTSYRYAVRLVGSNITISNQDDGREKRRKIWSVRKSSHGDVFLFKKNDLLACIALAPPSLSFFPSTAID